MKIELLRPLIRGTVAVILLLIARAFVNVLPMLSGVTIPFLRIPAKSFSNFILLFIIPILLSMGAQFSNGLSKLYPKWRASKKLVMSLVQFLSIVIAYNSLLPFAIAILRSDVWIYQFGIGILAVIPLIQGGRAIYESTDLLEEYLSARQKAQITQTTSEENITCPHCGASNPKFTRFCGTCGKELNQPN